MTGMPSPPPRPAPPPARESGCCSAISNGFELNVAREARRGSDVARSTELGFMWRVQSHARFDAFNVRVRISDGREGQVEVSGSTYIHVEHNAGWGLTYTFLVQGCNKRSFSSACTPWAEIVFRNTPGNDGHVDGVFARPVE
jgi:hypothetical protein